MVRRSFTRAVDVAAVAVIVLAVAFFVLKFWVRPHLRAVAVRPAPAVALDGVAGSARFDLARHRGRVVFLDFWASWCEPCQASIPLVQHFARVHPDVDVVSVDVGEAPAIAAAFARAHTMRDVVVDPDEAVAKSFGVYSFPTMVVIDPDGQWRGAPWVGFNPAIEYAMADAAEKYGKRREGAFRSLRERRST